MAVNWDWSDKKGEVVWKNKKGTNETFKWTIYHANCLGCMLYEYKEGGDDLYRFMCYFSDVHHLKRMLGLESFKTRNDTSIKEDWFKEVYTDFEIDYIKLDPNYPYWDKFTKYFVQAGYEVRLCKEVEE